jgi:hypothetical protein
MLTVPSVADAREWLTGGEARTAIRWWARQVANENGDTITSHRVRSCFAFAPTGLIAGTSKKATTLDGLLHPLDLLQ